MLRAGRATSEANRARESANPARVDVGIVGGGLVGVALAISLRERGANVTVLERAALGGEASRGAGGILGAQTESRADVEPGTVPLATLLDARAAAIAWAEQLECAGHGPTGLSREGALLLAFDEPELHRLEALGAWQRAAGATATMLTRTELARACPAASAAALGALSFPDDAHVDPPLYLAAACARARALGVALHEHTPVLALGTDGAGAFLEPRAGRRRFDRVVIAAGSWSSELLPTGAPQVKPIRGHMLELRTAARPFGPVLVGAGAYSIPRADGRITVGSTMEDVGHRRGIEAAGVRSLLAGALTTVPQLQNAEFVRAWSQFRPYAPAGLLTGETGIANVLALTGHHRNGILLARWSAERLAAHILG